MTAQGEAGSRAVLGIHHITAIAGHPQPNVDFYAGVLGLRLVKLTVNYDDPGTYHLYYGDGQGTPGTILTFFPWPGAPRGQQGAGQVTTISFSVPQDSLSFWKDRLGKNDVHYSESSGRSVVTFTDPDGLQLEIVSDTNGRDSRKGWSEGPVPQQHAIRGFASATITETSAERTARLLVDSMGFRRSSQEGNRSTFEVGDGGPGKVVHVLERPEGKVGQVSVGTVHHIAWRTPTDDEQLGWREELRSLGLNVTPIIDRNYFHSIYYREPGGVLFEIATDPPGFTVDEPLDQLGTSLRLPARLEPLRLKLEQHLPPITLPSMRAKRTVEPVRQL